MYGSRPKYSIAYSCIQLYTTVYNDSSLPYLVSHLPSVGQLDVLDCSFWAPPLRLGDQLLTIQLILLRTIQLRWMPAGSKLRIRETYSDVFLFHLHGLLIPFHQVLFG